MSYVPEVERLSWPKEEVKALLFRDGVLGTSKVFSPFRNL